MESHGHDFTEMVLITGGEGIHTAGRLEYAVSTRDFFVVAKGQAHGYRESRNLQLVNVVWRNELSPVEKTDAVKLPGYHALFRIEPGIREEEGRRHLKVDSSRWKSLMALVTKLERELAGDEGGSAAYAQTLLTQIMIEASRAFPGEQAQEGDLTLRLARVFSYIEENYHRRILTPELACVASMSLSTLQRHFRAVTGESLTVYINRLRVERSAELLRETNLSITEVAFLVGFEDSNYFSKVFRRFKGQVPSGSR